MLIKVFDFFLNKLWYSIDWIFIQYISYSMMIIMMAMIISMKVVAITRQLLLFYFCFFIIISRYHFGISYSMSVVINSFEIDLKYEIHLSNFFYLSVHLIMNCGWTYKLFTAISAIQWENEMKIEGEGGIDFIKATSKKKWQTLGVDFDLQSNFDRANKTVLCIGCTKQFHFVLFAFFLH